jgi:hypothetical protein
MKFHTLAILAAFAAPAAAQQLLAIDSSRLLSSIDPATGVKTPLLTVTSNAGTTGGLAYDAATGTMYLTSTSLDSLFTLDVATGVATLVGFYGNSSIVMHGLEFDDSTNTLYGWSSHDGGLYTIDKTTGAATLVGTSGVTSFSNLLYDSAANVMYATNSGTDSFYLVDRATGGLTLIGALGGPTNPHGLAFDSDLNRYFLVCSNTDALYTVDVTTGAATLIGSTSSGNLLGLAYIPGTSAPVVYCTAGVSSNGCVPAISVDNQPSASAANSCVFSVANVEGQKAGLFFYGIDNTAYAPAPWGSGTSFLCVKAPTQRMPSQSSGGTAGACDGSLTQDWNVFQAANPGALGAPFSAGQKVYVQAWYRDPPASKTTNLSDALELTVQP